jgi:hypothetical protein
MVMRLFSIICYSKFVCVCVCVCVCRGNGYPKLWPSPNCTEPLDVSSNFTFEVISGILSGQFLSHFFLNLVKSYEDLNTNWTNTHPLHIVFTSYVIFWRKWKWIHWNYAMWNVWAPIQVHSSGIWISFQTVLSTLSRNSVPQIIMNMDWPTQYWVVFCWNMLFHN